MNPERISKQGLLKHIREFFETLVTAGDCSDIWPDADDFSKGMLCGSEDYAEKDTNSDDVNEDLSYIGFPDLPYYAYLGHLLWRWGRTGVLPLERLPPAPGGVAEVEADSLADCTPAVAAWFAAAAPAVGDLLRAIGGARGCLRLLGLRCTAGSAAACPPTRRACLAAFAAAASPAAGCVLTVGAKALCKHAHRGADAWWGPEPRGSEADKNAAALAVVTRVLDEATWRNVHLLPHGVAVLEVRTAEGYGARWLAKGGAFRGFLEPQMEDGHGKRWRH